MPGLILTEIALAFSISLAASTNLPCARSASSASLALPPSRVNRGWRSFLRIAAGLIFLLIAVMHVLRLAFGWRLDLAGWAILISACVGSA